MQVCVTLYKSMLLYRDVGLVWWCMSHCSQAEMYFMSFELANKTEKISCHNTFYVHVYVGCM